MAPQNKQLLPVYTSTDLLAAKATHMTRSLAVAPKQNCCQTKFYFQEAV
jgi:hypothetical protein